MLSMLAPALLATAAAAAEPGGTITGTASVIDGDTFAIGDQRVRLWGVDAPEGSQVCQRNGQSWECGDDAAAALEALLNGQEVACTEVDRDRYGRTVATCMVGGQDIGAAMVRQGWALDFERGPRPEGRGPHLEYL
jgi:endonuclease YncB( thermonuclease family)